MKPLAERLPANITRAELEKMLIEKAINDGAFWNKLISQPKEALAEFFGKQPPQDLDVEVLTENAQTFYLVTPYPKYTEQGMAPGRIMPRIVFTRRLNYLLLTDEEFKSEFAKNYRSAITLRTSAFKPTRRKNSTHRAFCCFKRCHICGATRSNRLD